MKLKVQNQCCQSQELDQSTLVTKLLEIERFRTPNNKSLEWIENLSCLWRDSAQPRTLQLESNPCRGVEGDYVAVSYSWAITPGLESASSGGFTITDPKGDHFRQSVIRNEVLERVVRYADLKKISRIWIDQECSPQDDHRKKHIAINSMDLVYHHSNHSVGLLAVILRTQDEVNRLQQLMLGRSITQDGDGTFPTLASPTDSHASIGAFDVLYRLYSDRWWTRALLGSLILVATVT